jgi:hypothetical protein
MNYVIKKFVGLPSTRDSTSGGNEISKRHEKKLHSTASLPHSIDLYILDSDFDNLSSYQGIKRRIGMDCLLERDSLNLFLGAW